MAQSNFVDYVKIFCRSGKGGGGSKHFFRSKHNPNGGPDGGNGGGKVLVTGTPEEVSLVKGSYTGEFLKKYLK